MREVFIYYRIHMNEIEMARRDIQAFQARMTTLFPGLSARLLQRADASDHAGSAVSSTWMEHYRIDAAHATHGAGVTESMQARIAEEATAQLSHWIAGPRHTEVFTPCAF